jgi:lipoprotein-anchoring transpeptidase ErfK/SrfK
MLQRCGHRRGLAVLALLCGLLSVQRAGAEVEFDVDLGRYRLEVRDPGGDAVSFPISIGSPAHPTPRGSFTIERLIQKPAWIPGPEARRSGQRAMPASYDGPMGIAKMPFRGAFALHGGAHPLVLGKPVTLGCVRLSDRNMHELIEWLDSRAALSGSAEQASGEILVRFQEPAALRIR